MSSRPLAVIGDRLQDYPGFQIQDWTNPDIPNDAHLELGKALKLAGGVVDQSIVQLLKKEILRLSMGVFIWVKLVLREICRGIREVKTDANLVTMLQTLPQELEDLYSSISQKMKDGGYEKKAVFYLRLLTIQLDLQKARHKVDVETKHPIDIWASFHPTLLDLAFMANEDSINPTLNVTQKSGQKANFCPRTQNRLRTRLMSNSRHFNFLPSHLLGIRQRQIFNSWSLLVISKCTLLI